jgi:anti-sigma regulatory factor (Ser/Thr protein kinase)
MLTAVLKSRPPDTPEPWPLVTTIALGTTRESVSCARLHTTTVLYAWNLEYVADDAELIVSELVTNALQASWSCALVLPVMMRLRANAGILIIEVWDAAPAAPAPRSHAIDADGGRGLEIVAQLSQSWGHHMENGGKVVWALLSL